MICIHCGKRSKVPPSRPSNAQLRCPHCDGGIAFAPGGGDPLSDKLFARALARASAEGRLRYCRDHVYYELRRSLGTLSRSDFAGLWTRWEATHGAPAGVVGPWPSRSGPPPSEPDIGDYSFERVIITQHAWTVDFLLWNNFHFETNSAVLSIEGYPHDRSALIRAMLDKNPELVVIALHDASAEGCAMVQRLISDEAWFATRGYVIDVGLGPAHRQLYAGLWDTREAPLPRAEAEALVERDEDPGAGAWLAAHTLDLAVVRPEKAMRRLFRATRQYGAMIEAARYEDGHAGANTSARVPSDAPRTGSVYRDDNLLGAGKRKRLAYGELLSR